MHDGQFWPFFKSSHFSSIRCFLERSFAHNNSNVVVRLTIWRGPEPMHGGQFWPFLECSYFSNLRCFLERFFPHNKSNVVVKSHLFCIFNF